MFLFVSPWVLVLMLLGLPKMPPDSSPLPGPDPAVETGGPVLPPPPPPPPDSPKRPKPPPKLPERETTWGELKSRRW